MDTLANSVSGVTNEVFSLNFLKWFLPLFGGIIAWFINEWRKISWEDYKRKEVKYDVLLSSLKGFLASAEPQLSAQLKQKFIDELVVCWLYCPDDVIKKGYAFLDTVKTDHKSSNDEKSKAVGEFVLAIRKDLFSKSNLIRKRTELRPEDFQLLKPNP